MFPESRSSWANIGQILRTSDGSFVLQKVLSAQHGYNLIADFNLLAMTIMNSAFSSDKADNMSRKSALSKVVSHKALGLWGLALSEAIEDLGRFFQLLQR